MKALAFHGPGVKAFQDVARPALAAGTDAIVQVDTTTDVFARAGETGALKVVLSRDSS